MKNKIYNLVGSVAFIALVTSLSLWLIVNKINSTEEYKQQKYLEGVECQQGGVPADACPYPHSSFTTDGTARIMWMNGYIDSKLNKVKQK